MAPWILLAEVDELGRRKKGDVWTPTKFWKLTRLKIFLIITSAPIEHLLLTNAFIVFLSQNTLKSRLKLKFAWLNQVSRKLFRVIPAGRSLNIVSPLSSLPVVILIGLGEAAKNAPDKLMPLLGVQSTELKMRCRRSLFETEASLLKVKIIWR